MVVVVPAVVVVVVVEVVDVVVVLVVVVVEVVVDVDVVVGKVIVGPGVVVVEVVPKGGIRGEPDDCGAGASVVVSEGMVVPISVDGTADDGRLVAWPGKVTVPSTA
jgi:hypothetical protein